ncbi:hypothetical protein [Mycetocola sp. 2940]|uniref:hypothetical protein n=1 Tax=Mycetocola sp. 2940 TaxID=3156452 RepID=UPI003398C837
MRSTHDDIDVSQGSSISVETDDLFLLATALAVLAVDARDWSHEAAIARCVTEWSADAAPFGFAEPDLARSGAELLEASALAESLGLKLERAAVEYANGEQHRSDVGGILSALAGILAGGFLRNLTVGAGAPTAAIALLITQHPEFRRLAAVVGQPVAAAIADHPELLVSPAFVRLVRTLVASADDVAMGATGVAPTVAWFLGDEGAGVVGLGSMAEALLLLAGRNAYMATPLTMTRSSTTSVSAPATLADAAARIPASGAGKPQVRIERYADRRGGASYAVYIAGTSDFSVGGSEPFDMASNLAGIAGRDTAAQQATVEAMNDAGIRRGDAVSFFGHSQGGLVATRIAASGVYSTQSLVTFGSPSGQIRVPDSIAHVAVEHAEDITPALGGAPIGGTDGRERIVVTRGLFDETGPPPGTSPGDAHHMARYAETAELIDGSPDPRLTPMREALSGFGAGGWATLYRAERDRG